ncbi:MAG TPA: hypothetical protein VGB92_17035 [Longimicrobium sp.]|jgi:hypothetical protein
MAIPLIPRARSAAFIAGMCSLMAAGPGTLLIPAAVRLTEPVVCAGNESIQYARVRYSYHGPGESSLEVTCVNRASEASRDVFFPAAATLFGIYFVVLFFVILLRSGGPGPRGARVPSPT